MTFFYLLYKYLNNYHTRNLLRKLILKLDGGEAYSTTIRKIFMEFHRIEIGYGTYGGCFALSNMRPNIRIGSYCSFAQDVKIFRANHPYEKFTTHPIIYEPALGCKRKSITLVYRPLEIGHDVWIGANAIILPGVSRIGNGAVIGASSVVTKDVGPYEIVAGNPARAIRMRFDERQIAALESSRWWELDRHELADRIGELDAMLQNPENPE